MRKKLVKHGNSLALVIDKPVLELLRIDSETPLEISTDGQNLVIHPVDEKHRRRVDDLAKRAMSVHADTFSKLAK